MNKISAIEAWKVKSILEDFNNKLNFLDLLKQNAGGESTEQQSDEITKAMDEQKSLEQKYAQLVMKRGQLTGISQKQELQETKNQIEIVAKELKNSTRILCRQLQDNPDVTGNQQLIKSIKKDLTFRMDKLMDETSETQSFTDFKSNVEQQLEEQQDFERLVQQEKTLNAEIREINENLKKKMDEFAKEATESSDEISKLRKQVNECKTQSDLEINYKQSEINGELACIQRLDSMAETEKRQRIEELREQIEVERQVSERIKGFIEKKRKIISGVSEDRDKLKDKVVKELENVKEEIKNKNEDGLVEIDTMKGLCDEAEDERRERGIKDEENEKNEQAKIQEKVDMDLAAKYVQQKWHWYQTEGKNLAKKRKGKGKGKGKKKGKK